MKKIFSTLLSALMLISIININYVSAAEHTITYRIRSGDEGYIVPTTDLKNNLGNSSSGKDYIGVNAVKVSAPLTAAASPNAYSSMTIRPVGELVGHGVTSSVTGIQHWYFEGVFLSKDNGASWIELSEITYAAKDVNDCGTGNCPLVYDAATGKVDISVSNSNMSKELGYVDPDDPTKAFLVSFMKLDTDLIVEHRFYPDILTELGAAPTHDQNNDGVADIGDDIDDRKQALIKLTIDNKNGTSSDINSFIVTIGDNFDPTSYEVPSKYLQPQAALTGQYGYASNEVTNTGYEFVSSDLSNVNNKVYTFKAVLEPIPKNAYVSFTVSENSVQYALGSIDLSSYANKEITINGQTVYSAIYSLIPKKFVFDNKSSLIFEGATFSLNNGTSKVLSQTSDELLQEGQYIVKLTYVPDSIEAGNFNSDSDFFKLGDYDFGDNIDDRKQMIVKLYDANKANLLQVQVFTLPDNSTASTYKFDINLDIYKDLYGVNDPASDLTFGMAVSDVSFIEAFEDGPNPYNYYEVNPTIHYVTLNLNFNGFGNPIDSSTNLPTFETSYVTTKGTKFNVIIPTAAISPTCENYTFKGWFSNEELTMLVNLEDTIATDKTLYAKWVQKPTVTFKNFDDSVISSTFVNEGTAPVAPETPTIENYVFVGWKSSLNGEVYASDELPTVTNDVDFTAVFEYNMATITIRISDSSPSVAKTYDDSKYQNVVVIGTTVDDATRDRYAGSVISKGHPTIKINKFELFKGETSLGVLVTADDWQVTLDEATNYYLEISYIPDSLSIVTQEFVDNNYQCGDYTDDRNQIYVKKYSKAPTEDDIPLDVQIINSGESIDLSCYGEDTSNLKFDMNVTNISSNDTNFTSYNDSDNTINTYIVYPNTDVKVSLDFNGHGNYINEDTQLNVFNDDYDGEIGDTFDDILPSAIKDLTDDDYEFLGWFKDQELSEEIQFTDVVNSDITIYAKWVEKVKVTVKFVDDSDVVLDETTIYENETPSFSKDLPTKENYSFVGWRSSVTNELYINSNLPKVTIDTTFKAEFVMNTISHTVTFVDYNDSVIDEINVEEGKNAIFPEDPTREGYDFAGWDKDGKNIIADTTIKATYTIKKFTVTYKDFNGDVLSTSNVDYNSNATAPTDPTREGYTFKGWDKDGKNIKEDTVITATYDVKKFKVVYKDYDGSILLETDIAYNLNATAPTDPTREGYTFKGWDKDGKNIKEDTVITATYTKITGGGDAVDTDSKPNSSTVNACKDEYDKNCDGVTTCEERYGKGWYWDNAKGCQYKWTSPRTDIK